MHPNGSLSFPGDGWTPNRVNCSLNLAAQSILILESRANQPFALIPGWHHHPDCVTYIPSVNQTNILLKKWWKSMDAMSTFSTNRTHLNGIPQVAPPNIFHTSISFNSDWLLSVPSCTSKKVKDNLQTSSIDSFLILLKVAMIAIGDWKPQLLFLPQFLNTKQNFSFWIIPDTLLIQEYNNLW